MRYKTTWQAATCIALCAALTACGSGNAAQEVKVTETTVSRQCLNEVYPMDQAKQGYEWEMQVSREEVIRAIEAL